MSRKQTDPAQRDNIGRMASRLLQPAHLASLAKRGADSLRRDGVEATWRQVIFRVDLVLAPAGVAVPGRHPPAPGAARPAGRDTARHAARISVVVPLYNTPPQFLRQMVDSVPPPELRRWQLVLVDASDGPVRPRTRPAPAG